MLDPLILGPDAEPIPLGSSGITQAPLVHTWFFFNSDNNFLKFINDDNDNNNNNNNF
jgi:hypothetical protein